MVATVAAPCDNGDIVLHDLSGGVVANIARSPTVRPSVRRGADPP